MILRLYAKAQVWRAAISDRVLEDRGATAVEYALMLVLIAVVMDFSGLVLAEAVLSYVGVGVDPSTISFGTMNSSRCCEQ